MRGTASVWFPVAGVAVLFALGTAAGQQATISTPYHSVSDSFFENIGTSWGFRGKGFNVQFGGPTMAAPPFGHFDPGAGANGGLGFRRNGSSGFFNGNFSQGSRQSFVSQAPCVTVTNGMPGYIAAGTLAPFVVSYVPVVGGFPTIPAVFLPEPEPLAAFDSSDVGADALRQALRQAATRPKKISPKDLADAAPVVNNDHRADPTLGGAETKGRTADAADSAVRRLALAQESTAGRPAPSVQEAKRLRAREEASQQAEARVYFERGLSAEEAGKLGAAKAYYQMAARRAAGDFQREILQRIESLKNPPDLGMESRRAF
jgi:hypothetical protein